MTRCHVIILKVEMESRQVVVLDKDPVVVVIGKGGIKNTMPTTSIPSRLHHGTAAKRST